MKIRFSAALLLAVLAISVFTGCSVNALQQLDAVEDAIENRLDTMENAIERRVETPFTEAAVPKAAQPEPSQSTAPRLTKEEAQRIALDHAGLAAEDVNRLRVEFDYDDGRPEYEVDFHHGGYEYDYEIHAETGKIITWDKDRDD